MIDPRQLEALESIARLGTFLKASEELRISQPAISERIRLLEEGLGRPLLVRSTPVRLTELGQKLISHFHQVKSLEDQLVGDTQGGTQKWLRVPIAVNYDSLSSWFIAAATPDMISKKIQLEIYAANENKTLDYLRTGVVLGCVSSDPNPITGCRATPLGRLRYRCVASNKLFKRMKISTNKLSAETLLQLPALTYGKDDNFLDEFLREHYGVQGGSPPSIFVPFLKAMKEALLAGWGYGLILDMEVAHEIESGRLIDLSKGKTLEVQLYWHSVQLADSALSQLSRNIIQQAKKSLNQR